MFLLLCRCAFGTRTVSLVLRPLRQSQRLWATHIPSVLCSCLPAVAAHPLQPSGVTHPIVMPSCGGSRICSVLLSSYSGAVPLPALQQCNSNSVTVVSVLWWCSPAVAVVAGLLEWGLHTWVASLATSAYLDTATLLKETLPVLVSALRWVYGFLSSAIWVSYASTYRCNASFLFGGEGVPLVLPILGHGHLSEETHPLVVPAL